MNDYIEINPADITVPPGRRALDEARLDGLAKDMDVRGLDHPVTVYRTESGKVTLAAGGHRLAAALRLGWPLIGCHVIEEDDAWIAEISENLHRAELSTADRADQFKKWAEYYATVSDAVSVTVA